MFDFIVRNIFILLPLAIFIGVRIMEARKKYQESHKQSPQKSSGALEDERENTGLETRAWREVYAPAPPKRPPVKRTPEVPVRRLPSTKEEIPPAAPASVQPAPGKDFTENLKFLSPLQRAVALAEILGPPKGI